MSRPNPIPAIVSIVILVLAIFSRWPYEFYTLLRIVVCLSAIYVASQAHGLKRTAWVWTMAGTAILFNPLVPIRVQRSGWQVLDGIGAAVFIIAALALRPRTQG